MKAKDIAIVGAGVVGLSLALSLADQGFSIIVIEKEQQRSDRRYVAINATSQQLFSTLGIWEVLVPEATAYKKMVVWDALGFSSLSFDAEMVHHSSLGYIVAQQRLIEALWARVHEHANIQILYDEAGLTLEKLQALAVSLVVGADGAHSTVRQLLKIPIQKTDYHQTTVVCEARTAFDHQHTAWQRFLPKGPLAFLPLSEPNHHAVLWTTTTAEAVDLLAISPDSFCSRLALAFDRRLGHVLAVSPRQAFPLVAQLSQKLVMPRAVLVGEAAHRIHPLAGQGLNVGLADVIELSRILIEARLQNRDIGHGFVLSRYSLARFGPIKRMMFAMNSLNQVFGMTRGPIVTLRSLGLSLVENSPLLKKQLIQLAMGL